MDKTLTRIGISVTLLYLAAVVVLGWSKWNGFLNMELNEIGDFLAGAVGPLALLWLILGYFQQGQELRLSTEALRQQADELKQSVEHQQALVEVTKRQVDVQLEAFAEERKKERDALRPKMSLQAGGRTVSGGITEAQFTLENYGYRATEVVVEICVGDRLWPAKSYAALNERAAAALSVGGLRREDVGSIRFVIAWVDGAGEKGILEFPGTVQPAELHGVNVVLGKPFERAD